MGKISLITGAYRGLGLAAAKMMAARDYRVFLAARKTKETEQAVEDIRKAGGKAEFLLLDISDEASVERAAAEFGRRAEHLDVLINNAAIFPDQEESPLKLPGEKMLNAFRTNTLGAIWMIQKFYSFLKKSKEARVINVSSGLGSLSEMSLYSPAYSVSKTALNAVTKQFSLLFKEEGIAVNSVCPGWCRTDMGGAQAPRSAEDGAKSILWLAFDAPKSLSGGFYRDGKKVEW